jgi:simple sugar transport system ATP-binding protein
MAKTFRFAVDPGALVEDISVGQQQRVEIMKALYRNADLLILDEPTAVLTPQEASDLFEILRTLRREGISIIFISHKLNEVLDIADRVTVLRRGKTIETVPRAGATEASLARAMVGRDVLLRVEKTPAEPGDVLLSVRDLHVRDDRLIEKVRGVSLDVRAGEIVGIAGVDGNGQTELIDALTGLRRIESGTVTIGDHQLTHAKAKAALDAGMGHIPEDRQRRGLVLEFSIAENLALHDYAKAPDARWGWTFPNRVVQRARSLIREFDIRGGGPFTRAGGLSGGNQQKLAIEYLHRRLITERDEGRAILLISLELDEILSLADRILVLYEGEIVGDHTGEVSEEEIGLEMLGGGEVEAA